MKPRLIAFMLIFAVLASFLVGCNKAKVESEQSKRIEQVSTNKAKPSDLEGKDSEGPNETQTENQVQEDVVMINNPHLFPGFAKDKVFSGGQEVKNYSLANIRRAAHPEFTRLIFDFSGNGKNLEANLAPQYEISYHDETQTLKAVFRGVTASLINKKAAEEIKKLAPIIETIKFEPSQVGLTVSLKLKAKVSYQVFDLNVPARIVVVMDPDGSPQRE